jgi:hypothetical protein
MHMSARVVAGPQGVGHGRTAYHGWDPWGSTFRGPSCAPQPWPARDRSYRIWIGWLSDETPFSSKLSMATQYLSPTVNARSSSVVPWSKKR